MPGSSLYVDMCCVDKIESEESKYCTTKKWRLSEPITAPTVNDKIKRGSYQALSYMKALLLILWTIKSVSSSKYFFFSLSNV